MRLCKRISLLALISILCIRTAVEAKQVAPGAAGLTASAVNGPIKDMVATSSGDLYVLGDFTQAGAAAANTIAKWNGSSWSALGTGLAGLEGYAPSAGAMTVDASGNVYIGGDFTAVGGVAANNIAKWNGTAWSPLGSGIDGRVTALAADNAGNIYAAGYFITAGGTTVNHIARWDGTVWSALGSGVGGPRPGYFSIQPYAEPYVNVLALDGSGNLYAGGNFTVAGGKPAARVAKWDGSQWLPLGLGAGGFRCSIQSLAVDKDENLFAGGYYFKRAGLLPANNLAVWNGAYWSGMGWGLKDIWCWKR